jgi:hypothetical protein
LILSPEQYSTASAYDLLRAAEQGFVGVDQRFLHAIVDDPAKSLPDLVRFGVERRRDARQDLSDDLVNIVRHLRAPEALPLLIDRLRGSEEADLPTIAALQEIGAPAVEPLLELCRELENEDITDAPFVLASLGVRDPRILDTLIRRIDLDPVDTAHCLAAYGDPAAIPALRAALDSEGTQADWVQRSIRLNIEELESGPRPSEPEPFDLWSLYPPEADPRFDLLTESETELFLDSPDDDNRFAAVAQFAEADLPRRLWDKLLDMARHDRDFRVRGESWRALLPAIDRQDVREAMRACLENESAAPAERAGALSSLAPREGDRPEIQRRILQFYDDPATRSYGLHAMAVSQDSRFEPYFRRHLDDTDPAMILPALLGVALARMESEARRLPPLFDDEDLRADALYAYALVAPVEPTRAGLRRLFQKIEDLAAGLSDEEAASVRSAINSRADEEGLDPVFDEFGNPVEDRIAVSRKVGRNEPCPCGSGKKYKKCCGA